MAADDLFKRYLEVGASMLGMSRQRAESIVRDLVASGEVAKGQATKAADWLVERGRTGTEELADMIRREIRDQVAALGLATRDDLARLEARLEEVGAAATPRAAATRKAATGKAPSPKAATPEAATPGAATPEAATPGAATPGAAVPGVTTARGKAAATRPAKRTRAAAPRQSSGRGGAGITRSGSVKPGPAGGDTAGAAPPAGEPAPPKG